jgi:Mrp family chromosome partitioning ATPase
MEAITARLKEAADIVIFDTPPVTAVTDAALSAAKADATIMVIQSHRASKRIVNQGLEALTKVNARVVGAVLNNVPGHVATPYYGRGQGEHHEIPHQPIDLPAPNEPAYAGRAEATATLPGDPELDAAGHSVTTAESTPGTPAGPAQAQPSPRRTTPRTRTSSRRTAADSQHPT